MAQVSIKCRNLMGWLFDSLFFESLNKGIVGWKLRIDTFYNGRKWWIFTVATGILCNLTFVSRGNRLIVLSFNIEIYYYYFF